MSSQVLTKILEQIAMSVRAGVGMAGERWPSSQSNGDCQTNRPSNNQVVLAYVAEGLGAVMIALRLKVGRATVSYIASSRVSGV